MASPAPCRRIHQSPRLSLEVLPVQEPVKFDLAFIERGLREHHALMDLEQAHLASQIVSEVEAGIVEKLNRAKAQVETL